MIETYTKNIMHTGYNNHPKVSIIAFFKLSLSKTLKALQESIEAKQKSEALILISSEKIERLNRKNTKKEQKNQIAKIEL